MAVRSHLEGLWSADLIGDRTIVSIGVVVFEPVRISQDGHEQGRVLGGDRHYAHRGTYRVENGDVSGRLRTRRYDVHEDGPQLFAQDESGFEFQGVLEQGGCGDALEMELTVTEPGLAGTTGLRLVRREELGASGRGRRIALR